MTDSSMTKSELIDRMVSAQAQASGLQLTSKDVELAVKTMLEQMSNTLATGGRIEVRGFGSFSLHYRAPRIGRNPKPASPWVCRVSMFLTSNPARSYATASTPPWNVVRPRKQDPDSAGRIDQ